LPDPNNIKNLDFSVLNDVISYIMSLPIDSNLEYKITLPDLKEKIQFNGLSETTASYLYDALIKVEYLEKYLSNNSDFIADSLRNKLSEIYIEKRDIYKNDELFWNIVNSLSPKLQQIYQTTVIIIMAKYFETCDIFEVPIREEDKNDSTN
jgi:hypothetical protein